MGLGHLPKREKAKKMAMAPMARVACCERPARPLDGGEASDSATEVVWLPLPDAAAATATLAPDLPIPPRSSFWGTRVMDGRFTKEQVDGRITRF